MTTDFRTGLQLLFDAAESFAEPALGHHQAWQAAMNHTRTLLAQPEPQLTDADATKLLAGLESLITKFDDEEFVSTSICELEPWKDLVNEVKVRRSTPQPPADGEVAELVKWLRFEADDDDRHDQTYWLDGAQMRRIAELLQRQHPQPVPVSERLPGAEDCDRRGRCWWFTPVDGNLPPHRCDDWSLYAGWLQKYTHWLPANAMPTPETING